MTRPDRRGGGEISAVEMGVGVISSSVGDVISDVNEGLIVDTAESGNAETASTASILSEESAGMTSMKDDDGKIRDWRLFGSSGPPNAGNICSQ